MAHIVGGKGFDDLLFNAINNKVHSKDEILHFGSDNTDLIDSSDYDQESVELTANLIHEGL